MLLPLPAESKLPLVGITDSGREKGIRQINSCIPVTMGFAQEMKLHLAQ